jgi:hypothetical protein
MPFSTKEHPSSLEAPGSPHESLSLLVSLLGASSIENGAHAGETRLVIDTMSSRVPRENDIVSAMLQNEVLTSLSCPALSLKHDREESALNGVDKTSSSTTSHVQTRNQVQGNAAALLARQIRIGREDASSSDDSSPNGFSSSLSKIPGMLLGNVYESFAVLVDSRLRAYSNFLARQGVSQAKKNPLLVPVDLKALELKIEALLAAGRKVSVHSVSTHFEEETRLMEDEESDCDSSVSFCFQFRVQMKLIVPGPSGETETVSVSLSAPGHIIGKSCPFESFCSMHTLPNHANAIPCVYNDTACFLKAHTLFFSLYFLGAHSTNSQLEKVHVEIDTNDLLSQMMKQASRIVGVVAAMSSINTNMNANTNLVMPPPLLRSESAVAMPPPLPKIKTMMRPRMSDADGFALSKGKLEQEHPIVSPDLSARSAPTYSIPYIHLEVVGDANRHDYDPDKTEEAVVAVAVAIEDREDDPYALSPDQCADIVDCVFGDLDDAMLMGPSPTKKPRIA